MAYCKTHKQPPVMAMSGPPCEAKRGDSREGPISVDATGPHEPLELDTQGNLT